MELFHFSGKLTLSLLEDFHGNVLLELQRRLPFADSRSHPSSGPVVVERIDRATPAHPSPVPYTYSRRVQLGNGYCALRTTLPAALASPADLFQLLSYAQRCVWFNLRSVDALCFRGNSAVTDEVVEALVARCGSLTQMDLASTDVSDRSVLALIENCPGLQYLDLRGVNRLSDRSISALTMFATSLKLVKLEPLGLPRVSPEALCELRERNDGCFVSLEDYLYCADLPFFALEDNSLSYETSSNEDEYHDDMGE